MKQDFEGFLDCSYKVHFSDIAGKTECMVKNGYDPTVYTVQQATDLAHAQMRNELDHPTFGVASVIFGVFVCLLAWWIARGIVNAIRTRGQSLVGLFGADDGDAIGSVSGGKLHWTVRKDIDGGFDRY